MTALSKTLSEDDSHKFCQYLLNDHKTKRQRLKCIRNYCMAVTILESGLRVGELVKLRVRDLIFNCEPVTNLVVNIVIAKNHHERIIPVSSYLDNAIKLLFEEFWKEPQPSLSRNAWCYPTYNKQLSTRQVERIFASAGMRSLNRPVNPHLLRHTFATRLSRVTSIRTVQLLLGHRNLSSTQVYTHPSGLDLNRAICAMHMESVNLKSD